MVFVGASAVLVVFCYWCIAVALEEALGRFVEPPKFRLSYGQPFVLVMTPMAALLGATHGLSLSPAWRRGIRIRAATTLVVGFVVAATVGAMWHSQVASYGRDRSEVILYAPLPFVSMVLIMVGILLMNRARSRSTNTGPEADASNAHEITSPFLC
jgi:hypothetical protein